MFLIFFIIAFFGLEVVITGGVSQQTETSSNRRPSKEECARRIYRDCNYPTTFTDEELENVRQYLNYSFTVLADIKPDKPLCPKLHVRHEWKCLSQPQKTRVTNAWKQMYEKKIFQRLTDIHVRYWPAWHKSGEFMLAHRWICNEVEKAMQVIDPGTSLPYWNFWNYGSQPERSSIWDTLGHSGNYSNGFMVSDGIYADWGLIPSMKRHWLSDGTIIPWLTPEFFTSVVQKTNTYAEMAFLFVGIHFPTHLSIGGYEGQYSVTSAPYDALFYMHHATDGEVDFFKWQLRNDKSLTPLSYMLGWKYNQLNGSIEQTNLFTDTLTGVPGVRMKELFWLGFGELCFVPDQLVKPINKIWKGIKTADPIPTAAKRLPKWIVDKYFPYFKQGQFSHLFHLFEEVGECNTECHPITKPTFLNETEQGRRQLQAFRYDVGVDVSKLVQQGEDFFYQMWLDLNEAKYCSPYVTKY